MAKSAEGSTQQLVQFCLGYFATYSVFLVLCKYFTEYPNRAHGMMGDPPFSVYTTAGGMLVCLVAVLALGWFHLQTNRRVQCGPISFPVEFFYLIPSGLCTAVVIPTTTLMYSLPVPVMVAMVIMRGSVIVIGRLVDAAQIAQGVLHKKVYWQENVAVLFAILGVSTSLLWPVLFPSKDAAKVSFDFVHSKPAMTILGSYLGAYLIRIYIMNYYKNTRAKGVRQDNKGYFAIEQIVATIVVVGACVMLFQSPTWFGWHGEKLTAYRDSFLRPNAHWFGAGFAGGIFGIVAFFSVFLFMFKGRTATFAALANRLTSLVAGTAATVIFWVALGGPSPKPEDWGSLAVILVAVGFLTKAEMRRAVELAATRELEAAPAGAPRA